jgi:putative intracellular protease/amidase
LKGLLVHKLATFATAVAATLVIAASCTQAPTATQGHSAAVDADEQAATIAGLRPPKRQRPVVAVLGLNDGTETTDYLVPYAVLKQSSVADVWALATEPGVLRLHPALTIKAQATTADFDTRYPDGADYVIVPAMHRDDDATVLAWIKAQATKGALIVGVCSGVKVVSNTGLLHDRAATGHWYDIDDLRRDNPAMRWVRDRRYVVDRRVATTTGITASLPVSLAIVEAIGGEPLATKLAQELGVTSWDATHDSRMFRLRGHLWTAIGNGLAFWNHESIGIPVADGIDEIALAFTADIYSRTYRSRAVTLADRKDALTTRRGLQLLPDAVTSGARTDVMLGSTQLERPAQTVDTALNGIAERYGEPTAAFVALQLEYPR